MFAIVSSRLIKGIFIDYKGKLPLWIGVLVMGIMVATITPSLAVQPSEMLSDASLEARARSISHNIRCLVCQNQSIDDSDAELAADLRKAIRQRLLEGDKDEEVRLWLINRYGHYVLLKPPVTGATILLWAGPLLFVLMGGWLILRWYRLNRQFIGIDETEDSLLDDENDDKIDNYHDHPTKP